MKKRLCAAIAAMLFVSLTAGAAVPAAELVPDLFDPGRARRPYIGEWLEYVVCYPVDPLENSLSPNPLSPPGKAAGVAGGASGGGVGDFVFEPRFEPPAAWRRVPLRLEIVQVGEEGFRALLRFGGLRREVSLPLRAYDEGEAEFVYEAPQPEDVRRAVIVGDEEFVCTLTRRRAGGYGFARLSHSDLPFGLARFATRYVDVILVDRGVGLPPDFPSRLGRGVDPEPGLFFEEP